MSSTKIRVLQLIKGLGRGGAEMLIPSMIRNRDGDFSHRIGYFLPRKGALVPDLHEMGVEVDRFTARGPAGMLVQAPRIASTIRSHGIHLVHAHLPLAGVVGRLAGRLAGVPVVYTEHNLQETYHPVTRRMNLATWGMQRSVIAVSEPVAESARAAAGEQVPVEVVLNGVDVERFDTGRGDRSEVRRALGIPPESPVAGTVAVFRQQKRLDRWLEVAKRVADDMPGAQFLIVGDGPERGRVEQLAAQFGLEDRVHLVGLQEDVRPYLEAMDVYLMASDWEGLPVALLEAMATALPPVSTAVGGIPDVIEDGLSGLLVEANNAVALADAVTALLLNQERRSRLGQAAQERVGQGFSARAMTRKIEAVYRRVLGTSEGM